MQSGCKRRRCNTQHCVTHCCSWQQELKPQHTQSWSQPWASQQDMKWTGTVEGEKEPGRGPRREAMGKEPWIDCSSNTAEAAELNSVGFLGRCFMCWKECDIVLQHDHKSIKGVNLKYWSESSVSSTEFCKTRNEKGNCAIYNCVKAAEPHTTATEHAQCFCYGVFF